MNLRRMAFRMTEIFDYRTFAVAGAFGMLLLVGYLVFSSAQTARDALDNNAQQRKAASRRIDGLQRIVADQAQKIADGSIEQAQLRAGMEALSAQVQQFGGKPVFTASPASRVYVVVSPQPSPSPSRSSTPTASPTRKPTAKPSPTCSPLPVVGCRLA